MQKLRDNYAEVMRKLCGSYAEVAVLCSLGGALMRFMAHVAA